MATDKKAKATLKKQKEYNKIDPEIAQQMKDQIKKWKREEHSKKLERSLEEQGYEPSSLYETKAGSKIGAFDTAGRLRGGLKSGGRVGFAKGSKRPKGGWTS